MTINKDVGFIKVHVVYAGEKRKIKSRIIAVDAIAQYYAYTQHSMGSHYHSRIDVPSPLPADENELTIINLKNGENVKVLETKKQIEQKIKEANS